LTVERAFERLKDEFGGTSCPQAHGGDGDQVFGVLVLTVDQLLRMVQ